MSTTIKLNTMATVKQIFNEIKMINPEAEGDRNNQFANYAQNQIWDYLPKDSLAFQILSKNDEYTEKQLWVIAYELFKNEEYCAYLDNRLEEYAKIKESERNRRANKRAERNAKRNAAKEAIAAIAEKNATMEEGMKVYHSAFGECTITKIEGDVFTVDFVKVGEKKLCAKFAKLEIL